MATFRRILSFGREKRGFYLLSLLLSAASTIFSFIPYYYFYLLLRLIQDETSSPKPLHHILLHILLWTLLYSLTYFLSLVCSHVFAFRIERNLKREGILRLLDSSFAFFDVHASGQVRKIIDDNTAQTHTIVAHMIPDMVNALLFPLCMLVLTFAIQKTLGFLFVFEILISIICFFAMYSGDSKQSMQQYLSALERLSSDIVEYVRGIQVVKIFNTKVVSFNRLYDSINHYAVMINRMSQRARVPFSFFETSMASFGALCIFLAYRMFGNLPINTVITFVIMVMLTASMMIKAVMKIMFFNMNMNIAINAMDKIVDIFGRMQEQKLPTGSLTTMEHHDIALKDVSFAYTGEEYVLKDVTITFEEGKTYALTGPSGGGKSTLAKVISGFYPIQKGEILIGGHPITSYTQETLERNISFIFQHAKLFKTTIFENVQIGNPNASEEEVLRALHLAQCDDILKKFPDGAQTVIGSKGVHLSGGEVQRIATARAILKDAPIIILDEASAASDPENEYEMQKAFSQLMKGKTVIMIAHRLTSIRNTDEIVVVSHGNIIEKGNHQTLMEDGGTYHRLHTLYTQANEWRVSC